MFAMKGCLSEASRRRSLRTELTDFLAMILVLGETSYFALLISFMAKDFFSLVNSTRQTLPKPPFPSTY